MMNSNKSKVLNNLHDSQWEFRYLDLIQYRDREGHCSVPFHHIEESGIWLGGWLENQRLLQRNELLPSERCELLDDLGVIWYAKDIPDVVELSSSSSSQSLNSPIFYSLDLSSPNTTSTSEDRNKRKVEYDIARTKDALKHPRVQEKLEEHQQEEHEEGKQEGQQYEQQTELSCLCFINDFEPEWKHDLLFNALEQYQKQKGHCDVPLSYTSEEGHRLGQWLLYQKQLKHLGLLDPQCQAKLEQAGIAWEVDPYPLDYDPKWEEMFQALVRYKKRHGHCEVPRQWTENGLKLGYWLEAQKRHQKYYASLDLKRQDLLNRIGVKWIVSKDQNWEKMFRLLVQHEKTVSTFMDRRCVGEGSELIMRLKTWLRSQRESKRKGKLDPKRAERLRKLGVFNLYLEQESTR